MSSTRRQSDPNAPLAQGRYMSAPEYAALRGLCGSAVAAKVAILDDPRARSLILFLDALSRAPLNRDEAPAFRPIGLAQVAAQLLAEFPDRIGTPSMHKFGVKPGQFYNAGQVRIVRHEVEKGEQLEGKRALEIAEHDYAGAFPLKGELAPEPEPEIKMPAHLRWRLDDCDPFVEERERDQRQAAAQKHPTSYAAAEFVETCRQRIAAELEDYLVNLCIDPSVPVVSSVPGSGLPYFRDIIGALLEYKARYAQKAAERIAQTEITRLVSRTLSRGLRTRRIVVVNGPEGVGKSFNAEQFVCEQHLGELRFIAGKGIVSQTTFFQSVSRACGLAAGDQQKSQQMQARVESYLERSGIMLVIDEAHRLFSQTRRMTAHPELMNWVYTLWDMKIPVALLVTPQFLRMMDDAERQTGWNSGQFKRRVEKWEQLPTRIGEQDLRAVACKLAPRFTKGMIDELVDFALPSRRQLDALKRALSAAQEFAAEAGRDTPNAHDLDDGIKDAQATDLALTTPLDRQRQAGAGTVSSGRSRRRRLPVADELQAIGSAAAEAPQFDADDSETESAERHDTLADTSSPARATNSRRPVTVPA